MCVARFIEGGNSPRGPAWLAAFFLYAILTHAAFAASAEDVKPRPAPQLPRSGWLNTPDNRSLSLKELRGKVVLVEFWTFACINCRHVLPYVKAWQEKYAERGLVLIGVHTPEFDFEHKPENVKKTLQELGITFPVVLDPDYAAWERFQNRYWPAFYLIDPAGRIVYVAIGEGNYERTDARIRSLLEQVARHGN